MLVISSQELVLNYRLSSKNNREQLMDFKQKRKKSDLGFSNVEDGWG